MPSKNEVKVYIEDSYYHIYNRGVEKRNIFLDDQDYSVFLSYLKTYLLPKDKNQLISILANPNINYKEKDKVLKLLRLNNFSDNLKLIAYCLMPNHFHFLIHQKDKNTIKIFMNSLITRFSMYFNKKYKRVGPLFRGVYKAVLVKTDEQLVYLSRYIHFQAIAQTASQVQPLQHLYHPSSYQNFLGNISQKWINPSDVLVFFQSKKSLGRFGFKKINSYQSFVEDKSEEFGEFTKCIDDLYLE